MLLGQPCPERSLVFVYRPDSGSTLLALHATQTQRVEGNFRTVRELVAMLLRCGESARIEQSHSDTYKMGKALPVVFLKSATARRNSAQ
jgi:hypothetical protein